MTSLIRRRTRGLPATDEFATFWRCVKSGLNLVGAIGSVSHPALAVLCIGTEIIDQFQNHVANRRSQELLEDIAYDLYFANQKGELSVEQIQQVLSSEEFNSTLLQARLISTRTHQEEKREALRNAVMNVALGREQNADRQGQFLSLIDQFTATHLGLLQFLGDPSGYYEASAIAPPYLRAGDHLVCDLVLASMPTLKERLQSSFEGRSGSARQFIESVLSDLQARKLVHMITLSAAWALRKQQPGPASEMPPCVTHLGEDFLAFVTDTEQPRSPTQ